MNIIAYLLEHNRIYSVVGIFIVLGIAIITSNNRRHINLKLILNGLLLQWAIALAVLKTNIGYNSIKYIAYLFESLYMAADKGIEFLFGNLAMSQGQWGFIFAIKVLPVIVFFGAFMGLLFYCGIVQRLVALVNKAIRPILGTSGAETVCAIANSFLGQTEAPLLIRHYLKDMTKSEFLAIMISGMGSISGSLLAIFALMGVPAVHLLAASVMSIPATIIIAKIMYPETEKSHAMCDATLEYESKAVNVLDAVSIGTTDGLWLALNVGAMLIAFLALLGMFNTLISFSCVKINELLAYSSALFNMPALHIPVITLDTIFAWICMPFAWLLGFTGDQAYKAAELIGTKIAINELVAYDKLVKAGLSERSVAILTYALCGFSNFSCIGIQIGGIGALIPEKRHWLSQLGVKAVFGGALSNLLSAMIASVLL